MKQAHTEPKVVDDQVAFNEETIIEVDTTQIRTGDQDVTFSQNLLCPVYRDPFISSGIAFASNIGDVSPCQVSPFSSLGDETIIGGVDTQMDHTNNIQ